MPRRAAFSSSVVGRIRAWFGLAQDELAQFLAVSPALVRALETGRRALSPTVAQHTAQLARHLPTPATLADAPLPDTLPLATPAPDLAALAERRALCLRRAARLRTEAQQLSRQAHHAARWALALPTLLPAPTEAPERSSWLTTWLEGHARPLSTEEVTRWHLLLAQARAYEAEAAALT